MHIALSFKTSKRPSAIVLDWVLKKGWDFWLHRTLWELVSFWSPGNNQNYSREGGLTHSDGTSSGLATGLLLSTRPRQRFPDPPERWGSAPVPGDNLWAVQQRDAGLPHPARRGSGAPCTEEHHYGGSNHHVPPVVCTYTMTEPWGVFPSSQSTRSMSITLLWYKEMATGRYRKGTLFSENEKLCCRKWHNPKWWFKTSTTPLKRKQTIHQ